jgi:hypothetical protein
MINSLIKMPFITEHKNGKMVNMTAINTNPLTNKFCMAMYNSKKSTICKKCFAIRNMKRYKNAQNTYEYNSVLFSKPLEKNQIPFINSAICRLNGHGELINYDHLLNYIAIVNKNKHCMFTLWTKKISLINKFFKDNKKPKNLILIWSNEKIDTIEQPPKHFDKSFNNVKDNQKLLSAVNCDPKISNCINCLKCYTKKDKTKNIIEKVK